MKLELAHISGLGQRANQNPRASNDHTNTHTHVHTYNLFLRPIVNLHFHHPKKGCTKNGACPPKLYLTTKTKGAGKQAMGDKYEYKTWCEGISFLVMHL